MLFSVLGSTFAEMPALSAESPLSMLPNSTNSSFDVPSRKSNDKTISGVFTYTNGTDVETGLPDHRLEQIKSLRTASQNSLTNGIVKNARERAVSNTGSALSASTKTPRSSEHLGRASMSNEAILSPGTGSSTDATRMNGSLQSRSYQVDGSSKAISTNAQNDSEYEFIEGTPSRSADGNVSSKPKYLSSPAAMSPIESAKEPSLEPVKSPEQPRLQQRHTLSVPQSFSGAARASRDFSYTSGPSEEVLQSSGRYSPARELDGSTVRRRRASLGLVRRSTRAASDARLEDVPLDEDAARWTEAIRAKRASRRRRMEEEDEDRVIVGQKVEEGHANWVTAYNMLTGIRFTVSRANAKLKTEIEDADFDVKHKQGFDVMGSEQTPGSKYDFKFKDYCPQVFRSLRQIFGIDPADYLMSLTSKYILSELGSPGKSGSFFYFSRDYKYIIKTIHHAEHKLLRHILRDYYAHVKNNPNTLISQFYGLHRVKLPYGRKIHFVVMNNLFPPHRDIHQTFDLKGSTVGRDFKEENLAANPRATLKDLNWLRRDMHLEFDRRLRQIFIEQLQRDVALLQRLQIMDYSLLVGIHDLGRGNNDNVREKTLQVFQPGGEKDHDDLPGHLMRTPSRLESARQARELRQALRKEKPVPMGQALAKMPDQLHAEDRRHKRIFYSDDGGIRATHEDGRPADMIYYLGVIDCLTHYGFVKRVEHFWKGLSNNRHQISPIPPHPYGERFLNFMTGITMTNEEAVRRAEQHGQDEETEVNAHNNLHHHHIPHSKTLDDEANRPVEVPPHSPRDEADVERTLYAAQKSTDRQTSDKGRGQTEEEKPDRTILTHTNEARMSTTLPIVQEARENSSHRSSRNSRNESREDVNEKRSVLADADTEPVPTHVTEDKEQTIPYRATEGNNQDQEYRMEAPLDFGPQDTLDVETDSPRRVSKPPRIGSGIIPTLSPLYRDDEIGIAR